jgi:serine/threonine protein kinase
MVMRYIGDNISQCLKSNYNELSLKNKLESIRYIAWGLNYIHNKGFIHKDLHPGNILKGVAPWHEGIFCYITDLGLCKPADDQDEKKIHGVLPYVAPEEQTALCQVVTFIHIYITKRERTVMTLHKYIKSDSEINFYVRMCTPSQLPKRCSMDYLLMCIYI